MSKKYYEQKSVSEEVTQEDTPPAKDERVAQWAFQIALVLLNQKTAISAIPRQSLNLAEEINSYYRSNGY